MRQEKEERKPKRKRLVTEKMNCAHQTGRKAQQQISELGSGSAHPDYKRDFASPPVVINVTIVVYHQQAINDKATRQGRDYYFQWDSQPMNRQT